MNSYRISYQNRLQNCTEIVHFSPSSFNGKEKDYESGFHYYGARYYWSELLTGWLSVDPMADKFPSLSSYNYCAWNPVVLYDPNGEFGVPTHKRMVKDALRNNTSLSKSQQKQIVKATGWYSDWNKRKEPIHFDNHNPNAPVDKGVGNIQSVFEGAIENYNPNPQNKKDCLEDGVNLHTIADFYSHSNYVELYQKYFGDGNLGVDDIPLYSDVYSQPEKYSEFADILEKELKTGVYEKWYEDIFSKDVDAHHNMNHDSPRSKMGRRKFNNIKGFDYASSLAKREIIKLVSKKQEE